MLEKGGGLAASMQLPNSLLIYQPFRCLRAKPQRFPGPQIASSQGAGADFFFLEEWIFWDLQEVDAVL